MDGIINVYKEAGYTSFDVVAKLRRALGVKKMGHTGTLDPDAVGVLPVCLGSATKVCELLMDETKEYVALMRLGVVTDTQDMSGTVLEEHYEAVKDIPRSLIVETINSFVGEIEQVPPMYSALKVNGQKLCDLARKGQVVERKSRKVRIDEIEILEEFDYNVRSVANIEDTVKSENVAKTGKTVNDVDAADTEDAVFALDTTNFIDTANIKNCLHNKESYVNIKIRVVCSKGTYIRTLIHDIGQKLGCGAAMEHLERTKVGRFESTSAYKIDDIIEHYRSTGTYEDILLPVDIMFDCYKALHILPEGMKALNNGNQIEEQWILELEHANENHDLNEGKVYRIYSYDNQFRALYEYHPEWKVLKPYKIFCIGTN